jgi:hypothetical protein
MRTAYFFSLLFPDPVFPAGFSVVFFESAIERNYRKTLPLQ